MKNQKFAKPNTNAEKLQRETTCLRMGVKPFTIAAFMVVAIISCVSTITLFLPAFHLRGKLLNWLYSKQFDLLYVKDLEKVKPQIEMLESLINGET